MSLLWLAGDSGPPGSGEHEGIYGGYHTSIDLRFQGSPPVPLALGSMPPAGEKLSSFFELLYLGGGWDLIPWDEVGCQRVLRGRSPWPGKGGRGQLRFSPSELRLN